MLDIIPTITQFAQEVEIEEEAINYLVHHGVIKSVEEELCIEVDCGGKMSIKNKKTLGSQTVAAKRRSVATQTTPPTTPTEGQPIRLRCPPS